MKGNSKIKLQAGDRIKTAGYPISSTGTVINSDEIYYQVRWDDGKVATFRHKPLPQTGRNFDFGYHVKI